MSRLSRLSLIRTATNCRHHKQFVWQLGTTQLQQQQQRRQPLTLGLYRPLMKLQDAGGLGQLAPRSRGWLGPWLPIRTKPLWLAVCWKPTTAAATTSPSRKRIWPLAQQMYRSLLTGYFVWTDLPYTAAIMAALAVTSMLPAEVEGAKTRQGC